MSRPSAARQRGVQRLAHLVAGVLLLGYVYLPVPGGAQSVVRLLVLPVLVATGVAMWQAPRLRRMRRALAAIRAGSTPARGPSDGHR